MKNIGARHTAPESTGLRHRADPPQLLGGAGPAVRQGRYTSGNWVSRTSQRLPFFFLNIKEG